MDKGFVYVLVTGAWVLLTGILGLVLRKKRGKVLRVLHPILIIFVIGGWLSTLFWIVNLNQPKTGAMVFIVVMGLTIVTNLVTGVVLLASGKRSRIVPWIHGISMSVMVVSLIGVGISLAMGF